MQIQRLKDVVTGAIIATMVVGAAPTAFAKVSQMDIPVSFNNIKVVVDGKELKTDKEPFIYEGTTYLPVRAVGEAVGKTVGWDGATQTVTLGAQATETTQPAENPAGAKEETKSFSRTNPVPIGTAETVSIDNYSEKYNVEIKVVNSERGSSAWTKILAANRFNEKAPDGKEYILAYIRATVKSVDGDKGVNFSSYDFKPFSGKDAEYDRVSVVEPDTEFGGQAFTGGSIEGYVAFLVDENDSNPKVSFGTKYDGTGGAWFKIAN